ncbi:hypothetical protein [Mucilaginibacter flavus]|uniref:hypothetical protein n=1 Tax=Mucilaginibacter flavus TaxID=931504 RepID=UPI0025B4C3AD|nr:hypothetical protein [Mucilaginibacter flavus]MDN3582360.1 hypothetical protein [Mucilaginibacter flavus]
MKYTALLSLTLGLVFLGYSGNAKTFIKTHSQPVNTNQDKNEIRLLIRQVLKWTASKSVIDLHPVLSKNNICIGFDLKKHRQNLEKLRRSGFFADEFIDNYNKIIQTLDKKIKNHKFEKWDIRELPPFNFDNDASAWCLCQDNLSWDNVDIEVVKLSSNAGALKWNWGKLDSGTDPSWKTFSYHFRVVKVANRWRVSYLEGFDYKESVL